MSMIELEKINTYYGDSHILFDVSMRVREKEVVALLGRNGAGKSTTLKTLAGVLHPRSGTISLAGANRSINCRLTKSPVAAFNSCQMSGASSVA